MSDDLNKNTAPEAKFAQIASAMLPQQMTMFARKAVIEYPPRGDSADSAGYVTADDDLLYYIKDDAHGRPIRSSEWICTQMSEAVKIIAPFKSVIELQNGKLVFGSRHVTGVADATVTISYLMSPTLSNDGITPSTGLKSILSSIYAFDMFINNIDRHLGNYLSIDL